MSDEEHEAAIDAARREDDGSVNLVCAYRDAITDARRQRDTNVRVKAEWEKLYNERNRLWRAAEDRLDAVRQLLSANGCDCDCEHGSEDHEDDCERCLACRIGEHV